MRQAAERGAKLTDQLLSFSRRQRLEPKPTDLNETVEGMRELLQSTLGGSVQLDRRLAPDLCPALVDPTQIELIILNLAINARDAMRVGGRLTIETSNIVLDGQSRRPEEPGPGRYVMLSVTDTGTGMTPEVLGKAFEPFFTTEGGRGVGLGLPRSTASLGSRAAASLSTPSRARAPRSRLPQADQEVVRLAGRRRRAPTARRGADDPVVDDDADVRGHASPARAWLPGRRGGQRRQRARHAGRPCSTCCCSTTPCLNERAEVAREARQRRPDSHHVHHRLRRPRRAGRDRRRPHHLQALFRRRTGSQGAPRPGRVNFGPREPRAA
jgi:hypothetical protein